jgi:hypothetical protein
VHVFGPSTGAKGDGAHPYRLCTLGSSQLLQLPSPFLALIPLTIGCTLPSPQIGREVDRDLSQASATTRMFAAEREALAQRKLEAVKRAREQLAGYVPPYRSGGFGSPGGQCLPSVGRQHGVLQAESALSGSGLSDESAAADWKPLGSPSADLPPWVLSMPSSSRLPAIQPAP